MKRGRGKSKGSAYERVICKKLSLWLSKGKRKDLFWRAAMSGGRATLGKKRGENLAHQAGDICAVHPDGHELTNTYFIECKHYRNLRFDRFLFGKGILAQFWKKVCKEAKAYERIPMLIVQGNRIPMQVLLPPEAILPHLQIPRVLLMVGGVIVVIVPLQSLLKHEFEFVLRRNGEWKQDRTDPEGGTPGRGLPRVRVK